jgi:hypothetical protein
VKPSVIPGTGVVGDVIVSLPASKQEPDLFEDSTVKRDMAEILNCTVLSDFPNRLFGLEFGAVYFVDRNQELHRRQENEFAVGERKDERWQTIMPCGEITEGFIIGTVHSHTQDSDTGANPSPPDLELAKTGACGRQHYVVRTDQIVRYTSDGSVKPLGKPESHLPPGQKCKQPIPLEE